MKFVFDLDGTICFKGKPVSEIILTGLEKLVVQGHQVVFASARPIRDLLPILHERFHQYPMLGGNGSIVADKGKILAAVSFDQETLSMLLELLKTYQVSYLIDSEWDYAYTGPAVHPIINNLDPQGLARNMKLEQLPSIIKMLLLTADDMAEVEEQLRKLEVVVHSHGNEGILDISPQGIDKWSGLQQLGFQHREYIAFGNDANDIGMFQHAGYTVNIGGNVQLAPFSSEILPLSEDLEERIVQKMDELGKLHLPSKSVF